MMRRTVTLVALAAALGSGALRAQDTTKAIRPGMTEADIRARWGDPVAVRRLNDWTYLFYRNAQERDWGFYDTVFLRSGQVVDAILRAPDHVYLGQSSSPPERLPVFTRPTGQRPARPDSAGAVTGVRVTPPPSPTRPD